MSEPKLFYIPFMKFFLKTCMLLFKFLCVYIRVKSFKRYSWKISLVFIAVFRESDTFVPIYEKNKSLCFIELNEIQNLKVCCLLLLLNKVKFSWSLLKMSILISVIVRFLSYLPLPSKQTLLFLYFLKFQYFLDKFIDEKKELFCSVGPIV